MLIAQTIWRWAKVLIFKGPTKILSLNIFKSLNDHATKIDKGWKKNFKKAEKVTRNAITTWEYRLFKQAHEGNLNDVVILS